MSSPAVQRNRGGFAPLACALALSAGCALVRHEVFPGQAAPSRTAPPSSWTRSMVPNDEGGVEAWLRVGDGVDAAHPGPAVLFFHANAEVVDEWWPLLDGYARAGFSVMLVEFRGYGRSPGTATADNLVADATTAFDLLASMPVVDRTRIALHGRSIGTGVACALATRRSAQALILQSGFTSLAEVVWESGHVPAFLVPDRFENESALRALQMPVLVVHGARDEVFAVAQARRLAAAAPRSTLKIYPWGHDDFDFGAILSDSTVFLRSLEMTRATAVDD